MRYVYFILLTVIVYSILLLLGEARTVADIIVKYPQTQFLLALLVVSLSFILRAIKWYVVLRPCSVSLSDALTSFFSGMLFLATPARIGELWRAKILCDTYKMSLSRGTALLIIDRLLDVFALSVLIIIFSNIPFSILGWVFLFLSVLAFALIRTGKFPTFFYKKQILDFGEEIHTLMKPNTVILLFFLSLIPWMLESIALWIVAAGIVGKIDVFTSIFVSSFSLLAGVISFLPGGTGLYELSMTGLLVMNKIQISCAVTITILFRLITLWYGFLIGILFNFLFQVRRFSE